MSYTIDIETVVFDSSVIEQMETHRDSITNMVKSQARQIIDTKDDQIRNALISLGWTPPTTNNQNAVKGGESKS